MMNFFFLVDILLPIAHEPGSCRDQGSDLAQTRLQNKVGSSTNLNLDGLDRTTLCDFCSDMSWKNKIRNHF